MTEMTVAPLSDVTMPRPRASMRGRLQDALPKLVLAPSFALVMFFVYGFILWTLYLSFTNSRAFTSTNLVGLASYQKLWTWTFETDPPSSWYTAIVNMGLFGGLYVVFCLALGLTLAILLDQKIRGEGFLRPIYLYPLALSFIVTGTAWKLFLDPGIGLEKAVHDWGWTSFKFDWVVNPRMMIYCVAIAGIWASSGFVMALFLAGLRGIDGEILKAAQIDGASGFAMYRRIVIPIMRPVFLSALIILTHLAIKSYDLVLSVTGKNPGGAAELPST
ncbi:MAG: sugar ABC transporter permease, partial [Roseiarcus sp.]